MDFVDQLLSDLREESCVFCHVAATEPWRIEKSSSPVAPFYIVLSGCMQMDVDGVLYQLTSGDFLVLPQGSAHHLQGCHSEAAEPIPLLTLFREKGIEPWAPGMRLRAIRFEYGGGGEATELLIGLFYFGDPRKHPLLGALPPALLLKTNENSDLSHDRIMRAIAEELGSGQPGWNFAVARHAHFLFICALRHYFGTVPTNANGWLRGMTDPIVSQALRAIHEAPGKDWSLQLLAKIAGSSRASFAQRFSQVMGLGAMAYLTTWRMNVAAGLLRDSGYSVAEIAERVGYSADGFSAAFKHWAGTTPKVYRLNQSLTQKQQCPER